MTEQELLRLKKDIDEAKNTLAELNGQKVTLTKQLKENWNCTIVEEAEKQLKKMQVEIEEIQENIDSGISELEETYNL
jgi:phage shock protein A